MALKHFSLGCSLVFFLLLAGAQGGDSYYGRTAPKPTPADQPKPEYEKPKLEHPQPYFEDVKPDYQKPEQKVENEKPTVPTPAVYENHINVDYEKLKPDYQRAPKLDNEKPKVDYEKLKPDYEKPEKPDYEKPEKPDYESPEKPDNESPEKPDYESPEKPDYESPEKPRDDYEKVKLDYSKHFDKMGLQGLVYCRRSGYHLEPLQGAVVRVTCLAKNENGYESAPVSFLCNPTNEKGYFFMTKKLSDLESSGKKVCECKAFLYSSPSDTCSFPTDAHDGVSGAPLKAHRFLPYNDMQLFSLGPFIYAPKPAEPTTAPEGGAY